MLLGHIPQGRAAIHHRSEDGLHSGEVEGPVPSVQGALRSVWLFALSLQRQGAGLGPEPAPGFRETFEI